MANNVYMSKYDEIGVRSREAGGDYSGTEVFVQCSTCWNTVYTGISGRRVATYRRRRRAAAARARRRSAAREHCARLTTAARP